MKQKIMLVSLFAILLSSFVVPASAHAQGIPFAAVITFADLGEKDVTVNTMYEQVFVDFPVAEGRQYTRAVLHLHMQHNPNLLPDFSDIVIALNDEPVADLILTPENAADGIVEIELPLTALLPGQNELLLRFSLRLEENGCRDVNDPDLSVTIFADSYISFETLEIQEPADLSFFPFPFSTFSLLPTSPQISIVLPATPNSAELTAAAQISASLGQASKWKNPPLWVFTADQTDQARLAVDALIVIDTNHRNTLAQSATPGLSILQSPYDPNQLMLVVSGADDADLLRSVAMLTTVSNRINLTGTHADPVDVTAQAAPDKPARASFADLGLATKRVRGIGLHDLYYPIDVPYDWKTTSDASIELRFKHGAAIVSASLMTAYINGFETANVRLDRRNDTDGRLIIQLSPRQIRPGRNWLHLVFDLHMPRENCKYRYFEEAWAEVSAEQSVLNLAHVVSVSPIDIGYMPSYLVAKNDLSADIFVLPAAFTSTDLTAMARIAAKLGSYSSADSVKIQATTADQFAPTAETGNAIVLGGPENNALIAQYDSILPQPLQRVNGQIQPVSGRELLPEEISGAAGYLQVMPSPWSRSSALLVVSANDPALVFAIVDALPTDGRRMKVQGNLAIITPSSITGFALGNLAGAPLSDSTRQLSLGILMGAFVLIIALGLFFRNRRRANG